MRDDYKVMKVFDLSSAPPDLRDADDLAVLRPSLDADAAAILHLTVGEFSSRREGPANDSLTREVTFTEFKLHRWLVDHGAEEGETILLRWAGDASF